MDTCEAVNRVTITFNRHVVGDASEGTDVAQAACGHVAARHGLSTFERHIHGSAYDHAQGTPASLDLGRG
jgi:hypothetical protein